MADRPAAKVLVVDDDAFIRRPLELFLRDEGFEPLTASDGEECLERVRYDRPAVIILDVTMPGRDGFEICRALKADPASRAIPVILLTGRDEEEVRERGRAVGAVDLVTKPYSPHGLIDTVRRLVDARELQRDTA